MNKRILASMATIGVALIATVGATGAYFSSSVESTDNVFTAGTLDLQIWGSSWDDSVVGTWVVSDMGPGDTFTGVLYVKNNGSLPIKALLGDLDVTGETGSGDGEYLGEYLHVASWKAAYRPTDGSSFAWSTSRTSGLDVRTYAAAAEGDCPSDDFVAEIGVIPSEIAVGATVALEYTFEFEETGTDQNNAQGDSVTIKYTVTGLSASCAEVLP